MKYIVRYKLQLSAFIGGIVIMTLEMVGSRILSPYFGSSINTWSVLIGIILGSLSLGYWYGGKCADRHVSDRDLALLFFGSGIYIVLVGLLQHYVINFILGIPSITLLGGSIVACIIFFFLPNVLLGMINPYLAKMMLSSLNNSGSKMGNLSALSTVGNIVGTFSASFILIPLMGITAILILIGIILILLSLYFYKIKLFGVRVFFICIFLFILYLYPLYNRQLQKLGFIDIDTLYGKVLVFTSNSSTYLVTGAFGYESNSSQTDSTPYLPHFDEVLTPLLKNPKNGLVIGGGTFNLSNYLLHKYPLMKVASVEIDKKIKDLAYLYFGYKENARHSIVIEDGRTFVNRSKTNMYDLIINDTFKDVVPPYYLLTHEAIQKIFDSQTKNGIYISNIASSIDGKKSWMLKSSYKTMLSVYPRVFMARLETDTDKRDIQNILLVAIKDGKSPLINQLEESSQYISDYSFDSSIHTLTDDYAPVEYNLMPITTGKSAFHFSKYYLKKFLDSNYSFYLSLRKQL